MKSAVLFLFLFLTLLIATPLFAVNTTPYVSSPPQTLSGDETVILPENAPGFIPQAGELDEIVGDTLIVGSTGWDAQHNGGDGRSLGYFGGDPWSVYYIWTKLDGIVPSNSRHVVFTRIADDGQGGFVINPSPEIHVDIQYRSGYCNLAFDTANNQGYPLFHVAQNAADDFNSAVAVQSPFVPTLFNVMTIDNIYANPTIWPHGQFGASGHIHIVSHEQLPDDAGALPTIIRYDRAIDTGNGVLALDGDSQILTDVAMNISADISANLTGELVTAALPVTRVALYDEQNGDWSQLALGQSNNDIFLVMSDDAGATFDTDHPMDITHFIAPDPDALPDTTAANGDTIRAYTDCSIIFDDQDRAHVAFTGGNFDYWRQIVYYESRIFHWMKDDEGNDVYTLINHQPFAGAPEAWGRTTDRPSLSFDTDTGILWCVLRDVYWGPDTTDWGNSGLANADIYVTASPPGMYNGLLWAKPVNITNTQWLDPGPAPAGSCQSETDPSLALRSEGDYLHIQYMVDLDAGTAIQSTPEGEMTNNPMIYHRVMKQTLIDSFEANAEWLQNYPMHVDSTGFWQDPGLGEWAEWGGFFTVDNRGLAVGEHGALQPNEFDLKQNYPNPFNASTKIQFNLARAAIVKLTVYDVLGREVATLLNRGMSPGTHELVFMADDLPSGVYFYKLNAGGQEKVRKMALMK